MARQTYNNGYHKLFIDNADGEAIRALKVLEGYRLDKRDKEGKECFKTCAVCYFSACTFAEGEICAPGDWEICESLYNCGLTIKHENGEPFII